VSHQGLQDDKSKGLHALLERFLDFCRYFGLGLQRNNFSGEHINLVDASRIALLKSAAAQLHE
jgi:hypothetical protein